MEGSPITIASLSSWLWASGGYSHWSHRIVALPMYSARLRSPCSRWRKFDAAASALDFGFVHSMNFFNSTLGSPFSSVMRFSDLMCVLPAILPKWEHNLLSKLCSSKLADHSKEVYIPQPNPSTFGNIQGPAWSFLLVLVNSPMQPL